MINLDNGSVDELYKGEAKMIVMDILKEYVKAHPNELRRQDIINGILKANKLDKTSAEIKSKVKNLLQGYSMMNASMQSDLESIGCTVMSGEKHHKIRLHGDNRYQVAMAKTGSDRRGGLNLASEINKIMF